MLGTPTETRICSPTWLCGGWMKPSQAARMSRDNNAPLNLDVVTSPAKTGVPPPRFSIVVLPFVHLSGDPEQDYLADIITAGLTAVLSRIRDAFVIAHSTALTYKGKAVDVRQIG
jgi:TolB-like protein